VWPDDVVGSLVTVANLNGNGAMDIITSTNRGTFVFWGKPHSARTGAEKSSHKYADGDGKPGH